MSVITRSDFIRQVGALGAGVLLHPTEAAATPVVVAGEKRVRVGVIGCGSVSNMYLPHLVKSKHVELVSLCDIRPERAKAQGERFGVANRYPHIDGMLSSVPFDLLVNLTDMQEHGRLNRLALLAGKHVWSEKPMADSYAEGRGLLELARKMGLRIWGAPAVVNSPQFAFMARKMGEGGLGRVAAAHAHYGHTGPSWSAFFYEKGGGSLPDLGVYNIATLTGLLGPARSVTAMTSIVTAERTVDDKGRIPVVAEDNAIVVMDHGNGVLSNVQCGFNYFDPYGHEGRGQDRPTITVWGSSGSMSLIGYDWAPFGVEMATSWTEPPGRFATETGAYVWQEGATVVAEALATGKDTPINPEHALHVLEVIEAARASQEQGRRIGLTSVFPWPVLK